MNSDSKESKPKKGIGFTYAIQGMIAVIKTERNFRIHLLFAFSAILMGVYLQLRAIEWCILVLTIALVMTVEMVNSAIERVMDYLSLERHPVIGEIKDIAAGAVLVTAIAAVVIGCFLFLPKLM
ncbi:diacylglycerol kinase family protein [Pontibacillus litoralis]|uniref:DeoR family transcriptional regulator n=1 Tax=Pontibacillus litoralis JSM 072002 TaxID=1385512 RepID=A0A0A5G6Z9_9BACI|nr:diacylglycerol kinase family protein [Pontibacillus litoralis]KGX88911.1 DeoR family transcriptional regulator [Pontibacillus litoralis JSM 072002]